MAARCAFAAIVEGRISVGCHAGSDDRQLAVVPLASLRGVVAAGQVDTTGLLAGNEVDFEARFVAAKDDRSRSGDRSREKVRPGDDQRAGAEVELLRGLIEDVAIQVAGELDDLGDLPNHAACGVLLRVDDRLTREVHPTAGHLNGFLPACGGVRRLERHRASERRRYARGEGSAQRGQE